MFNRQRGQVGIGDEVSLSLSFFEHFLKEPPVFVGRLNQPHARLLEPALNPITSFFERERTPVQAGIGPYANKGGQHWPAKTDRIRCAKLCIPPLSGGFVVL